MSTAKWKRIFAGILGLLTLAAGILLVVYAIGAAEGFWNPAVPLRLAILSTLLTCAMAFAALSLSGRLLRFSISGRDTPGSGFARAVVLGIGSFFPGFIFSMPLTVLWANHTWPGDGQSVFAAMEVSCYVGIATGILCMVFLLRKRNAGASETTVENRTAPQ